MSKRIISLFFNQIPAMASHYFHSKTQNPSEELRPCISGPPSPLCSRLFLLAAHSQVADRPSGCFCCQFLSDLRALAVSFLSGTLCQYIYLPLSLTSFRSWFKSPPSGKAYPDQFYPQQKYKLQLSNAPYTTALFSYSVLSLSSNTLVCLLSLLPVSLHSL